MMIRQLKPLQDQPMPLSRLIPHRKFLLWRFQLQTGTELSLPSLRAGITLGIRKKYLAGDLDRSLRRLLYTLYVDDIAETLACRDPEDKILAIQSLVQPEDQTWLAPLCKNTINWQDLYTRVARHLISDGYVDLLSLCRHGNLELPSWVPDWRGRIRRPWSGMKYNNLQDGGTQLFHAADETRVMITGDDSEPRDLILSGHCIDRICRTSSPWKTGSDDDLDCEAPRILQDEIEGFLAESILYSPETKDAARWKIPIGDKESNYFSSFKRATEISQSAYFEMEESISRGES